MPGTLATCPTCDHTWDTGFTISNVRVIGNPNVAIMNVQCPECGHAFSLGQGEGTWSTIGGRLRKVAGVLAEADTEALREFRAALVEAQANEDVAKATQTLLHMGLQAPTGLANQANRTELWQFLALIVAVIALVVALRGGGNPVTETDIERLIHQQQQETSSSSHGPEVTQAPIAEPRVAPRNAPCPCGSGRKFKRCHGAHPTSADHPGPDR